MKSGITWRRAFRSVSPAPTASPWARHRLAELSGEAVDVSDPCRPGHPPRRNALTPTGHGAPDRTLAGAAPAQADLKGAPPGVAGRPASALLGREAVTPNGPKPRTRALGSQGASSRTKDIRAEVRPGGRVVLSGGERRRLARASELSRRRCLQRSCPSRRRSGTRASRAGLSRGIPGRYFRHCQAFRAGRRHRD